MAKISENGVMASKSGKAAKRRNDNIANHRNEIK